MVCGVRGVWCRYDVVGVELDGDGMIPEALEKTLTELEARGE
jgi:DNA-binding transcriptional MocR family regulator